MAGWQKIKVTVRLVNGETEIHDYVGGTYTPGVNAKEGWLHLYVQDGDYAPITHVASYPSTAILSYKREEIQ